MLKTTILNPDIAGVLASTGHKDMIVISDAGFPIPLNVKRIDLAWKKDNPRFIPVLKEVFENMSIEKVILAEEIKKISPQIHQEILSLIPEKTEIEYISHEQFKEKTKLARAVIRTGEFTPFPNIILVAGCTF